MKDELKAIFLKRLETLDRQGVVASIIGDDMTKNMTAAAVLEVCQLAHHLGIDIPIPGGGSMPKGLYPRATFITFSGATWTRVMSTVVNPGYKMRDEVLGWLHEEVELLDPASFDRRAKAYLKVLIRQLDSFHPLRLAIEKIVGERNV